jgi:DNA-binding NarL/FixJ family response regulator
LCLFCVRQVEELVNAQVAASLLEEFRQAAQAMPAREEHEDLTPKEMQVLRLVAKGEDNKTIARQLGLSERTVSNYLNTIYNKLQINSRVQAALHALRRGWVELG